MLLTAELEMFNWNKLLNWHFLCGCDVRIDNVLSEVPNSSMMFSVYGGRILILLKVCHDNVESSLADL